MKKLMLRLDQETYEKLKSTAKSEDRNVSATIRRAIKQYLKD